MKFLTKAIKKVSSFLFCFGSAMAAIVLALLFVNEKSEYREDYGKRKKQEDEIEAKAEKKKQEAVKRISSASISDIADSYGTVCDAIADGKERFRRRIEAAIDD